MDNFQFTRAGSVADACARAGANGDAKYLAGGQTLLPVMKQRLAAPSELVALSGVGELEAISVSASAVVLGAMARHAAVAASPEVRRAIPALARLAGGIGDPHVRNRGTIGGSIANADPSADYPAAVVGLGATVHTNRREIAGEAFFIDLFTTALEPGELITRVSFPVPQRAAYVKFPNPASRYAVVGVMVAQGPAGVRVAVTGAGPSVFRVPEMEAALARSFTVDSIAGIAVASDTFNADIHASAEYRGHLVGVLARRTVALALGA